MDVAVGDIDGGLHGAAILDYGELVCGEDLVNHGGVLRWLGVGGKHTASSSPSGGRGSVVAGLMGVIGWGTGLD